MNKLYYFKEIIKVIKLSNKADKAYFPLVIIKSLVTASFPFVAIIYSAIILDGLIDGIDKSLVMDSVYKMIVIGSVLLIARTALNFICEQKNNLINLRLESEISSKTLSLDFEQLESQEIKNKISKAKQGINTGGGIGSFVNMIGLSIENIVSFIYSLVLMMTLFKVLDITNPDTITKIFNNPLMGIALILLISLSLYINYKILNKVNKLEHEVFTNTVVVNRLFGFLMNSSLDYKFSKDMRLYHVDKFISELQHKYSLDFIKNYGAYAKKAGHMMSNVGLLNHLILFSAYLIIGIKALLGLISTGEVLLLVSAITTFNTAITQFITNISTVSIQTKYLSLYDEYLKTNTDMYNGNMQIVKNNGKEYKFQFKNVSFHYPNSEEIILNDVSFDIEVSNKLAIVGPNGAGKTTLIKLLCRFYDPTKGQILLNGIDIKEYDYNEYIDLISVVFQDFRIFSTTFKENVTSGIEEEDNVVLDYLTQAGLNGRIRKLKKGIHTYIYSNFGEQGVEVSGGEAQKVAIARALYKNSPMVILDEPTSALDPISEYEIYTKFDNLVQNKTAVYISHRMASCKFCDKIIVLNKGKIIQSGSHDELLDENDGLYNKMWKAQAKYYNM